MAELPSGTVTFLLTDVEGSTALWEDAPETMRAALARHDALFEEAIKAHGGAHIRPRGEGDSRFAVFSGAPEAVTAALAIQRAFAAQSWPTPRPIKVRIGIHSGEAELRDGDYYGSAVNRTARLRAIGHGGQVLLSEATATLSRDDLPTGAGLLSMGRHRLKDLARPEHVSQVTVPDLPSDFPTLASLDARPHNLPIQPTILLGREREVDQIRTLLRDGVRLVTLTGPGGTGKTRLGLQVAAECIEDFVDGTFLVELAPITVPSLVPSTIAHVIGVRDVGGRPIMESLKDFLASRTLLLVLDNFEQVIAAAPVISDLLATSPDLQILVTSREPLRVRGEREYAVAPLSLPQAGRRLTADAVSEYAAVTLFAARAAEVRADFGVTDEDAPAVAEICARLDGLPLAIELAAARIRLLTPQAMLGRLDRRLPFLTGGARDLPARQQTLRGTISWSYELLDDAERRLFRRLSIFAGGWTLEAAETVCDSGDLGVDVLDGLESLVSKSFVRQDGAGHGDVRFRMLETIREYGLERLEESGEAGSVRRAHADFFLMLAEEAEPKLRTREQIAWLRRLHLEHDNMRAVLGWTRDGLIEGVLGLRLAGALDWFWYFGGLVGEGRRWAESMLVLPEALARTAARARALTAAARLATCQADYAAAGSLAQESVEIFRAVGYAQGAALALMMLGLGYLTQRNDAEGLPLLDESVAIAREVGDHSTLSLALGNLAVVAQHSGDLGASRALREESVSVGRMSGDRHSLSNGLAGLALAARQQGNDLESVALFKEALVASSELDDPLMLTRSLAGLAGCATLRGDYTRAARLFGAVQAHRDAHGTRELPFWRDISDSDATTVRTFLGDGASMAAWGEGRAMTLDQAVAYALEDGDTG